MTRFFFTTARDSLPGIVCAACPDHGSVGALVILAGDGSGEEAVYLNGGGEGLELPNDHIFLAGAAPRKC